MVKLVLRLFFRITEGGSEMIKDWREVFMGASALLAFSSIVVLVCGGFNPDPATAQEEGGHDTRLYGLLAWPVKNMPEDKIFYIHCRDIWVSNDRRLWINRDGICSQQRKNRDYVKIVKRKGKLYVDIPSDFNGDFIQSLTSVFWVPIAELTFSKNN